METTRKFTCLDCRHEWEEKYGTGRPAQCPKCGSNRIQRSTCDRGSAKAGGGGRRQGRCGQ